jgi:hypothetical protein
MPNLIPEKKYPATCTVHWATGPMNNQKCEKHKDLKEYDSHCVDCIKRVADNLSESWVERFREKFWWKNDGETAKFSASECHELEDFIRTEMEKAREEGYEAGLNLRKEYNDPKLLEKLVKQDRATLITAVEKEIREGDMIDEFEDGYNQAINTILELLKGSDKK